MDYRLTFKNMSGDGKKAAYADACRQMVAYPEAFAVGHCVYRKHVNARRFSYDMKLPDGAVLSGSVAFGKLAYGEDVEAHLRYVFELNCIGRGAEEVSRCN